MTPSPRLNWLSFPSTWHHVLVGHIYMLACRLNKTHILWRRFELRRPEVKVFSFRASFFKERTLSNPIAFVRHPSIMDWPDRASSLSLCLCPCWEQVERIVSWRLWSVLKLRPRVPSGITHWGVHVRLEPLQNNRSVSSVGDRQGENSAPAFLTVVIDGS